MQDHGSEGGKGGPKKMTFTCLREREREALPVHRCTHTLSWSGAPCCVLSLPQSHYFGRRGLTLLFLLALLVLGW